MHLCQRRACRTRFCLACALQRLLAMLLTFRTYLLQLIPSTTLCRCPAVCCPAVCSDDVDDQYTEKGRLLIRKEGEALANGLRIGEVLAADDLELQLPGLTGRKRKRRWCWCLTVRCAVLVGLLGCIARGSLWSIDVRCVGMLLVQRVQQFLGVHA
jgi:hypothetical protein